MAAGAFSVETSFFMSRKASLNCGFKSVYNEDIAAVKRRKGFETKEKIEMRFTKMHGAGNDFIILNNMDGAIAEENYSALAAALCHFYESGKPVVAKGAKSWAEFIAKNPGRVKR